MKRVIIVHGWGFRPDMNWYFWLKKELETKGFQVEVPEMPDTLHPKIEHWVHHLEKIVGSVDSQTYFVGHSMGCQTIMRFLERSSTPCGGAVFVAPWIYLDPHALESEGEEVVELARSWLETPIAFENVRRVIPKLDVFLSSNEPYGFVDEHKEIFEKKLGATVTILENQGHFTQEDEVTEIPEIMKLFS